MRVKQTMRTKMVMAVILALTIMVMVVVVGATHVEPPTESDNEDYGEYLMVEASLPNIAANPPELTENTFLVIEPEETQIEEQIDSTPLFTGEELEAVARTLAGECYEDEIEDKINVVWVICNRVADGRFGDGIIGVVTKKNQFMGYWAQGRAISESDYEVAAQVLSDYFNGLEPPHDYLYFTGGTGKTNNFSHTW